VTFCVWIILIKVVLYYDDGPLPVTYDAGIRGGGGGAEGMCCAVLCCILHVTIIRHLLLPVCSLVTGVLVSSFGTLEVSRGGGDFTGIVCII